MGEQLDRQKELYDRKAHGELFKQGDLVWLHTPAVSRGKSRKLHGQGLIVSLSASLRQYIVSTICSNIGNEWWSISTGSSLVPRIFAYRRINLHHSPLFPKQYIHLLWKATLSYWTLTLLRLSQSQEKDTVHLHELRFCPPPNMTHRHHGIHNAITQLQSTCYQLWYIEFGTNSS